MSAYGSWRVTADTQTLADTNETEVIFDGSKETAGGLNGVTHTTDTRMAVTDGGTYKFELTAAFSCFTANTTMTWRLAVDGAAQAAWDQKRKSSSATDVGSVSMIAVLTLTAAQVVSIRVKADKASIVQYNHAVGMIRRLDA